MLTVCPYGDAALRRLARPSRRAGDTGPQRGVRRRLRHRRPAVVHPSDPARGRRHRLRPPQPRHTEPIVGVDPDAYVRSATLAPASGRRRGARRRRATPRRRPRRHGAPLYLYGYGSYEACMDPDFGFDWWRSLPSLLDRGVVCAFGHPRGGGEMGRRWWLDGHLRAKPNTFDDQAAVADYLADGSRRRHSDRDAAGCRRVACCRACCTPGGPNASPGCVAEVPVRRRRHHHVDPSLPLTITEWDEWGTRATPRPRRDVVVLTGRQPAAGRRPDRRCSSPAPCTTPGCWSASRRSGSRRCGRRSRARRRHRPASAGVAANGALSRRDRLRAHAGPPGATPNSTTRPRSTPGSCLLR